MLAIQVLSGNAICQAPFFSGDFPLRVTAQLDIGSTDELGRLIDIALRPDGGVCVLDHSNTNVVCYSSTGQRLARFGRKGQGPGEFLTPYRLAIGPGGGIHVLELASGFVSAFTAEGRFVERRRLPIRFRQVTSMSVLPDGRLVIAGFAPLAGVSSDSAVHVFSWGGVTAADSAPLPELRHERSMGELPGPATPEVLRFWGSGLTSVAPDGSLLYARRIPYEIVRFYPGMDGKRAVLRVPGRVSSSPNEAFAIKRDGTSTTYSVTGDSLLAGGRAIALDDGNILSTRVLRVSRRTAAIWWDLISPQGKLLATAELRRPTDCLSPIEWVAVRRELFCSATIDDVPIIRKYIVAINPRTRRTP